MTETRIHRKKFLAGGLLAAAAAAVASLRPGRASASRPAKAGGAEPRLAADPRAVSRPEHA